MIYMIYKNILGGMDLSNITYGQDVILCGGVVIAFILDAVIISCIGMKIADILCRKYKKKGIVELFEEYANKGI